MNKSGINGKTIIITRSVDDSIDEFVRLTKLGAELIHFPTLEYKPVNDWSSFDNVVAAKDEIDFLVFTSGNSVKFFFKRCEEKAINWNYDKTSVVAVGKKTAQACTDFNIPVYKIPDEYSSVSLIKLFEEFDLAGKNILIPGSELAKKDLPKFLKEKGSNVFAVPIYKVGLPDKSIIEKNLFKIKNVKPDAFIFTSPSTFKNFLEIVNAAEPPKYFDNYVIAAIGSTTKKEIESYGIKVKVMPKTSTIEDLVEELIKYYNLN